MHLGAKCSPKAFIKGTQIGCRRPGVEQNSFQRSSTRCSDLFQVETMAHCREGARQKEEKTNLSAALGLILSAKQWLPDWNLPQDSRTERDLLRYKKVGMELKDKEVFPATQKARVQAMKQKGISHDSERRKQIKKLLMSYWYLLGVLQS